MTPCAKASIFLVLIQLIITIITYRQWGTEFTEPEKQLLKDAIIINIRGLKNEGTPMPTIKIEGEAEAKHIQSRKYMSPKQVKLIDKLKKNNQRLVRNAANICRENGSKITAKYLDYEQNYGLPIWIWMVFPFHNLFYCAVPKCASTTWKSYLMEDSGTDWEGLDTHEAAQYFGANYHLSRAKAGPVEWLSTLSYSHRMLIVRNPWARIGSAYEDKIIRQKWDLQTFCRNNSKYANVSHEEVSFTEFVECILLRPPNTRGNTHVHPLADLCAVCHVKYNLIVKLEELSVNEQFLMKTLNFSSVPDYTPPQRVKSSNIYAKYYEGLDRKLINRLRVEYQDDIDLFGYPDSPFE